MCHQSLGKTRLRTADVVFLLAWRTGVLGKINRLEDVFADSTDSGQNMDLELLGIANANSFSSPISRGHRVALNWSTSIVLCIQSKDLGSIGGDGVCTLNTEKM